MRIPIPFEYGAENPATAGLGFPFFLRLGAGTTPVVVEIDTHDGERKRKRWEEERRAKERLRNQIVAAFEFHTGELAPALEQIAAPGPAPLVERVDLERLAADFELSKAVREAARAAGWARAAQMRQEAERARQAALEADDEDALLLLM